MYDEASEDGTREIVRRVLADAAPPEGRRAPADRRGELRPGAAPGASLLHAVDRRLVPLRLGRRRPARGLLRADDGGGRAGAPAGRKLVACSARRRDRRRRARDNYAADTRRADAAGVLGRDLPPPLPADADLRRLRDRGGARGLRPPHHLRQPARASTTTATRMATTSASSPSSLAGGGVERLGEPLVRLTDSPTSMTRHGDRRRTCGRCAGSTPSTRRACGAPGRSRASRAQPALRAMGVRRLALCTIMLRRGERDLAPAQVAAATSGLRSTSSASTSRRRA